MIILPESDEELLAECRVDAYRASGSGGQHVNVTNSAIRLTHIPTSIAVTCQKERSQYLNKKECLLKLRNAVEKRNYKKPKRKATRMPRSVKLKNKETKQKDSSKKSSRKKPKSDSPCD